MGELSDAVATNRLEAFSDGVIAVAITLLVLNLTVPLPPDAHLLHDLGRNWGRYPAYVISFVTIGIIWINHHAMIGRLRQTDHLILVLNLLLLMSIVVIPFVTNLMALYVNQPHGASVAALVYSGALLLMAVTFAALNHHILFRKSDLLQEQLPLERRWAILKRGIVGLIPYMVAVIVAPFSPYATLIICGGIAVFYSLPIASGAGA